MKLINTIEVVPYDYAKSEYESPNTTLASAPSEWNDYWLKCFNDSNLGGLKPIHEGSFFVDIAALQSEETSEILKKELKNIDFEEFAEQVEHLCGGIAIELNGEIIIEPSCCGDLDNLSGWENIFSAEPGVWQQLWIGHPWIFYRRINDTIELSECTDLNIEDFKDITAVHTLPENELAEEIRRMRQVQDNFTEKVRSILIQMVHTDANDAQSL